MNDLKYIANKGEGYFCLVKLYKHNITGQEFAFKQLKKTHFSREEYRYRLSREINLLGELQGCENIITLIDHGEDIVKKAFGI